ncbi:MAG: glycosyltransferase [Myxococcota bacterium]|nr:glycosyltransferase [Myxococcota bacterium]
MINSEQFRTWQGSLPGFLRRQAKHLGQLRYGLTRPRRLGFVFGCQRSGTKMVMKVLDNSPTARIYHEHHGVAFSDFLLRSTPTINMLVNASPAPSQIFKPICDSHRADEILRQHPSARGLWIYRDAGDVANSAVAKWGEHQRAIIAAVASGDHTTWGWRTARLPESVVTDIQRVYRDDLTAEEGALLFWYMRNAFFFSLNLHTDSRVRLIRYESLVSEPGRSFQDVFSHLDVAFEPQFVAEVRTDSINRRPPPGAHPDIRDLCAALQARLDAWQPPAEGLPSPVLVIIDTLGVGGAERYAVTVANWMAERGVDVMLAAEAGGMNAALSPAVQFVPLPLDTVRYSLPQMSQKIRTLMLERRPAAVVANSLATTWIAQVAQLGLSVPVVNVAHGWPTARYRRVGPLMRVADAVVAVSPDVRNRLIAGGLPPERCTVIHNGVDCAPLGVKTGPQRTAARETMGAGAEDVLVIVVGRLSDQKAHHHTITVAGALQHRHPTLRFAIIGKGEREAELQGLIETAGLQDRVKLLGLRSDVPDLLGAADLYLSTSDWEGMPLATIEAMASQLPIVSTQTEGAGQLLTEACSIVVPIGNAAAMSEAISTLVADPDRRARLGIASRARALEHFSHDRMVGELVSLIATL